MGNCNLGFRFQLGFNCFSPYKQSVMVILLTLIIIIKTLKYFGINHGEQRGFFSMKSSYMIAQVVSATD